MENIEERLNRGLANASWKRQFPNAKITHLMAIRSDSRPLLFETNSPQQILSKSFRFESMWVDHQDMAYIIQEAWERQILFMSRVKNTKITLKQWNKTILGNVQHKI